MSDEKLTPEAATRLLRAKGAELENRARDVLSEYPKDRIAFLAADIALIAQLLADHIERSIKVEEAVVALNRAWGEEDGIAPVGDPLFNEDGTPWERPRIVPPEVW